MSAWSIALLIRAAAAFLHGSMDDLKTVYSKFSMIVLCIQDIWIEKFNKGGWSLWYYGASIICLLQLIVTSLWENTFVFASLAEGSGI